MIMMDFMYGIADRSCVKSNSDSLNKSVDKSFYDSRGFFAVILGCLQALNTVFYVS